MTMDLPFIVFIREHGIKILKKQQEKNKSKEKNDINFNLIFPTLDVSLSFYEKANGDS